MLKKTMILAGSVLALGLGAASGSVMAAQDAASSAKQTPKVDTDPNSNGKTSDRTPGNPDPARTPNASTTGASGTDAGQTSEGTSDRSPNKTNKSIN